MTIGLDMPPIGAVQATLSPSGDHFWGNSVSRLTPFCSGPRH